MGCRKVSLTPRTTKPCQKDKVGSFFKTAQPSLAYPHPYLLTHPHPSPSPLPSRSFHLLTVHSTITIVRSMSKRTPCEEGSPQSGHRVSCGHCGKTVRNALYCIQRAWVGVGWGLGLGGGGERERERERETERQRDRDRQTQRRGRGGG